MNKTFKAYNPATDRYIAFSIIPSLPPFEARALAIEIARGMGCSGVKVAFI